MAPPSTAAPTVPAKAPAPASATAPAAAAAAGQPKAGGKLVAAKLGDVANLDGHYWSPNGGLHVWLAYDTLARYDQNLKPQPQLAESWDVSSDFQTNHGQPAQRRDLSQRTRVHCRRRRLEPDPRAGSQDYRGYHRRLLCARGNLYRQRQEHRPAAIATAMADRVRHVPRGPDAGQREHRRRQQYTDQSRRHRPVRLPGMASGRVHAVHQEPQLLAIGPAVPGRDRGQRAQGCPGDAGRPGVGRRRPGLQRWSPRLHAPEVRHQLSGAVVVAAGRLLPDSAECQVQTVRRQARSAGAQLRAGPQAHRGHRAPRAGRTRELALAGQLASVRSREEQRLHLRSRQSQSAAQIRLA